MTQHMRLRAQTAVLSVILYIVMTLSIPLTVYAQDVEKVYTVEVYCPTGIVDTKNLRQGETLAEPEPPTQEYDGYEMAGWSNIPVIDALHFTPITFPITIDADIKLYAVYRRSQEEATYYKEIYAPEDIADGEYIVTAEKDGVIHCMENSITATARAIPDIQLSMAPDQEGFAATDKMMIWNITRNSDETFYLKDSKGYYITRKSNNLCTDTKSTKWNIDLFSNKYTSAAGFRISYTRYILHPGSGYKWATINELNTSSFTYHIRLYRKYEASVTTLYTSIFRTSEDQEVLPIPQNLAYANIMDSITLSWNKTDENIEYLVTIDTDGDSKIRQEVVADNVYIIVGVQACNKHRISVRAIDPLNVMLPSEAAMTEITAKPIVIINPDGGTLQGKVADTATIECDTKLELVLPQVEATGNLIFTGWDDESTDETEHFQAGETIRIEHSTTFRALWREAMVYSLTLVVNRKNETLVYNETDIVEAIDTPVIEGYKFYGWSTEESYVHGETKLFVSGNRLTSDSILYAVFIPEQEEIVPIMQTTKFSDGVYILVQQHDERLYMLETGGRNKNKLVMTATDITDHISDKNGVLYLDMSTLVGHVDLLCMEAVADETVRIKDLFTKLFISEKDGSSELCSDRITTWHIANKQDNIGTALINNKKGDKRWAVDTKKMTWSLTSSQSDVYTSGETYLFKVNNIYPIINGLTFTLNPSTHRDTLASPYVSITPYVKELFVEWSDVKNAASYIVSIPEINLSKTVSSDVHSYSISGLAPSHKYRVTIEAISDNSELCNSGKATAYATTKSTEQASVTVENITDKYIEVSVPQSITNPSIKLLRRKTISNAASDIFFSKYFEGASLACVVSIYNGTESDIPLDEIRIKRGTKQWTDSLLLNNMGNRHKNHIVPGEELSVCLYSPSSSFDKRVISQVEDSVLHQWFCIDRGSSAYNGNQSLLLERRSDDGTWNAIDLIGAVTKDGIPIDTACRRYTEGSGWVSTGKTDADGHLSDISTNASLLIRKQYVKSGNDAVSNNTGTFRTLATEWVAYPIPYSDNFYIASSAEMLKFASEFAYNEYYHAGYDTITTVQNNINTSRYQIETDINNIACQELILQAVSTKTQQECFSNIKIPLILPATSSSSIHDCECDILLPTGSTANIDSMNNITIGNVILQSESSIDFTTYKPHNIKRIISINSNSNSPEIIGIDNVKSLLPILPVYIIPENGRHYISLPNSTSVGDIRISNKTNSSYSTDWSISRFDGQSNADGQPPLSLLGRQDTLLAEKSYICDNKVNKTHCLIFHPIQNHTSLANNTISTYTSSSSDDTSLWGWNLANNTSSEKLTGGWHIETQDGTTDIPYITLPDSSGVNFIQDRAELITIHPYSPFFVQTPVGGKLTNTNTTTPSYSQSVVIQLSFENKLTDKTTIICNENAETNHYLIGHDLRKASSYKSKAQIYTECKSTKLAFAALPMSAMKSIPLGVYLPSKGLYTISLDKEKSYKYRNIILNDLERNIRVDLSNGDYQFTVDGKQTCSGRFFLTVSDTSTLYDTAQTIDSVHVVTDGQQIKIYGVPTGNIICLYDISGRLLHMVDQIDESEPVTLYDIPNGIYFVTIYNSAGNTHSVKVIK